VRLAVLLAMNTAIPKDEESLPDPPRAVRLTPYAAWSRALMLLLVILPLLTVAWFMSQGFREDLRLLHGAHATGRVIDRYTFDAVNPKDTMYRLSVRFTVGDDAVTQGVAATRDEYLRSALGDSVTVTYLPDDPSLCRLGVVTHANLTREPVAPSAWGLLPIALIPLGVYSLVLLFLAPSIRRARNARSA
jgi:hypothetical protein